MFRGCYFEYNGISSERYNLMLFYKDNQDDDFNSGGEFTLKTGNIPYSHEQLYYGKDFSENPLEFEVEIINPDDDIPFRQLIEIKNWLFGQDGWKMLYLTDEWQQYGLKCIFEPISDITRVDGYRGLKCKLRNASPFWYGKPRSITLNNSDITENLVLNDTYGVVEFEIPNNDSVEMEILPQIIIDVDRTSQVAFDDGNIIGMFSVNADSLSDAKSISNSKFIISESSNIQIDTLYLDDDGQINATDTLNVNTKFGIIKSQKYPSKTIYPYGYLTKPFFRLKYGINYCRVLNPNSISSITFTYIPMFRMGAF